GDLVYSGTAKTATATATGLIGSDQCAVTVVLVGDNVNAGTFTYKATALSNANYKLPANVVSGEYTITPKTVTVTAEDKEAYAGNQQPTLTYTAAGFIGEDTFAVEPVLSTDANMNAAGEYTITASGADPGSNYAVTYVPGKMIITNYPYASVPDYAITIASAQGGKVTANKINASQGSNVILTVSPNSGYELKGLKATGNNGTSIALTKGADGKYTFKMPAGNVKIEASFAKTSAGEGSLLQKFRDLKPGAWYEEGIQFVLERGLMNGTSEDLFSPNAPTTRGMIVTILWRMDGEPVYGQGKSGTFVDVPEYQWYTEAVEWAAANGIVTGYANGKFGAEDNITREQLAAILFRYAQYAGLEALTMEENLEAFPDADSISSYAIPALNWAVGQGLISGMGDGSLDPAGEATRAQAATILMRYCGL
ncbi:MAG: S-layer homology domain-containing protein, partial [Clostridiales bacterium]|nr:S-layer homology domain-containing protein [Clostridiales bacterium]